MAQTEQVRISSTVVEKKGKIYSFYDKKYCLVEELIKKNCKDCMGKGMIGFKAPKETQSKTRLCGCVGKLYNYLRMQVFPNQLILISKQGFEDMIKTTEGIENG